MPVCFFLRNLGIIHVLPAIIMPYQPFHRWGSSLENRNLTGLVLKQVVIVRSMNRVLLTPIARWVLNIPQNRIKK
jgi:hypothetical protein